MRISNPITAKKGADPNRRYHHGITGTDRAGRRYHALDPDVFYWAHATLFMNLVNVAEHFCGGLSDVDRTRLYAEHVDWYRRYGLTMRPVPPDWPLALSRCAVR